MLTRLGLLWRAAANQPGALYQPHAVRGSVRPAGDQNRSLILSITGASSPLGTYSTLIDGIPVPWTATAGLCRFHFLLQRRHVDDVAEPHFALLDVLIGIVDLPDRNNLDVGADPVLGAKVQHLLRVGQVADQ